MSNQNTEKNGNSLI